MNCPPCDYMYGFDWDADKHVGEKGEFFTLPIDMVRGGAW